MSVSPPDPGQELRGQFSVEASARRIRHYRYAEERMMRTLAGWIALTPELPAKLLLGHQVWDCAQHADLWGRRLPELRATAQRGEPPSAGRARTYCHSLTAMIFAPSSCSNRAAIEPALPKPCTATRAPFRLMPRTLQASRIVN